MEVDMTVWLLSKLGLFVTDSFFEALIEMRN